MEMSIVTEFIFYVGLHVAGIFLTAFISLNFS